jgi:hypothetical protein
VHHYAKDSALREPHKSPTSEAESDILPEEQELPEELPEEFPEFNTVEDLRQWLGIDDNTPSEDLSPEEELLGSPEEELLKIPEEELLEIPEFNWTEDLRQYLEL